MPNSILFFKQIIVLAFIKRTTSGICSAAYVFSWLDIQHIGNLRKIDKQIIKNIDFDNGIERIWNAYDIIFKVVDRNGFSLWINNPVFSYAVIFVVVEFTNIIICRIARRDNFNDEIRRTVAPFSIQLVFIANYHKIRLNDCKRLIRQLYIERSAEYSARSFLAEQKAA